MQLLVTLMNQLGCSSVQSVLFYKSFSIIFIFLEIRRRKKKFFVEQQICLFSLFTRLIHRAPTINERNIREEVSLTSLSLRRRKKRESSFIVSLRESLSLHFLNKYVLLDNLTAACKRRFLIVCAV